MVHYIGIPYVDMRDRGEVVSQALFGEEVLLSKVERTARRNLGPLGPSQESYLSECGKALASHYRRGETLPIQGRVLQNEQVYITTPDGYSGSVPSSAIVQSSSYVPTLWTNCLRVPIYAEACIRKGPVFFLPYGVGVKVFFIQDEEWVQVQTPTGAIYFTKKGYLKPSRLLLRKDLESFATQFLGLPYIWGGRTSFGYDCSGFVQMLYAEMGISLPRDSHQQIHSLQSCAVPMVGDLIFWGKSPQHIQHVGCFLGESRFIHATSKEQKPWLRISSLNDPAWGVGVRALFPFRSFYSV